MKSALTTLFLLTLSIATLAQTNLILNPGFENYDPTIASLNVNSHTEFIPSLQGNVSYVNNWYGHLCFPSPISPIPCNTIVANSPNLWIRNSRGGIPASAPWATNTFSSQPDTWNAPLANNNVMAGIGTDIPSLVEEVLEADLAESLEPGDFEFAFYGYQPNVHNSVFGTWTKNMHFDIYLRKGNSNDILFIQKTNIPHESNAPSVSGVQPGWFKRTIEFTIPDVPANYGYDKIILKPNVHDMNGSVVYRSQYAFIDDFSLRQIIEIEGEVDICSNSDIDLTVEGIHPPFSYSWSGPNGFTSSSEDLNGLAAGSYEVIVTDANGNTAKKTFSISPRTGIIYVDFSAAAGANNGSTWKDAYIDLQDALDLARMGCGTEIWVSEGVYHPHNVNPLKLFEMVDGVPMYGGFATDATKNDTTMATRNWNSNQTVLSGNLQGLPTPSNLDSRTIIRAKQLKSAKLDGFIITRSNDPQFPSNSGGMEVYNSKKVEVNNCTFEYNYGSLGALVTDYSEIDISGCNFRNNETTMALHSLLCYKFQGNMVSIANSEFTDNLTGVYASDVHMDVTNTKFIRNSEQGVEWRNDNLDNDLNIIDCTFEDNRSVDRGGAVSAFAVESNINIIRTDFIGNSTSIAFDNPAFGNALAGGGALCLNVGDKVHEAMIRHCRFIDNSATNASGGAIFSGYGKIIITDCLFDDNFARYEGGAVTCDMHYFTYLVNCTFTKNTVGPCTPPYTSCHVDASNNATLYVRGGSDALAPLVSRPRPLITSCIFWGNNTDYAIGHERYWTLSPGHVLPLIGANYISPSKVSFSIVEDSNGSGVSWTDRSGEDWGDNLDVDPIFVGATDYQLKGTSPAIDKGNNILWFSSVDLNSDTRIQNGRVDMGAYESDPANPKSLMFSYSDSTTKSNDLDSEISYYPNPTNGFITIANFSEGSSVQLFSASGKLVLSRSNFRGSAINLNLSGLENGLYLLIIEGSGVTEQQRIILDK